MRHPFRKLFIWSHHEKSVVIDQKISYIGGVDLCFGRFERNETYDLKEPINGSNPFFYIETLFPGADYNNVRVMDFKQGREWQECLIDKNNVPRMPWRDIHCRIEGQVVQDFARNFIQYWNYVKLDLSNKNRINRLAFTTKDFFDENAEIEQDESTEQRLSEQPIKNQNIEKDFRTQKTSALDALGRKSSKENIEKEVKFEIPIPERSESQDHSLKSDRISGLSSKNHSLFSPNSTKYIQSQRNIKPTALKSNFFTLQKKFTHIFQEVKDDIEEEEETVPVSNPKNYGFFRAQTTKSPQKISKKEKIKDIFDRSGDDEKKTFFDRFKGKSNNKFRFVGAQPRQNDFNHQIQIVRSAGSWSLGLSKRSPENSIHLAYLELIEQAEHFIYIENQFFISSTARADGYVKNRIAEALVLKILEAHEANKEFVVCVVIPLLPGFQGDIWDAGSAVVRIQLGYELETICQSSTSIFNQLKMSIPNFEKYIKFFGLRRSEVMEDGNPATEMIYIHSKLMIVDDRVALIGSANINDRSLLGSRDSELAVVIEDKGGEGAIKGLLAGEQHKKSAFAKDLRERCFKTIFGIEDSERNLLEDPTSSELWEKVQKQALINQAFYTDVFGSYPCDHFKSMEDVKKIKKIPDSNLYRERLGQVKGWAVPFAAHFLEGEGLRNMGLLNYSNLVPDYLFT